MLAMNVSMMAILVREETAVFDDTESDPPEGGNMNGIAHRFPEHHTELSENNAIASS